MGAVLHTLNIRLSPTDLEYIINHAGDRVIIADEDLLPLLEPLWEKIPCVELLVICRHGEGGDSSFGNQIDYEEFIAGQTTEYEWPEIPETSPMGLCYTSGTTAASDVTHPRQRCPTRPTGRGSHLAGRWHPPPDSKTNLGPG